MNSAQWIDYSISILGGIYAVLLGYRVLGPKPDINPKYDVWHNQWGKHLKWGGPLLIAFSLVQIVLALWA